MNNICTVIVTYSNRFNFLKQAMESCISNDVRKIIVVDNASSEESRMQLKEYARTNSEKVITIHLPKNLGSAGGFKRGIEEAVKYRDCEYILLLDDDNVMLENCANVLLYNFNKLESIYGKDSLLLSSYRINLHQLSNKTIERGVFLGFQLKDLPRKFIRIPKKMELMSISANGTNIELDTAPWGGLFFHKQLIQKYGFPNEEFILYADDTEFTYRITKNRGKILLISDAKIMDIDKKMGGESLNTNILTYFSASKSKVYYDVRNTTYFEVHCKMDKTIIRKVNKLIYISILRILSIIYNKKNNFDVITEAIKDGESGKLGYNDKYPL